MNKIILIGTAAVIIIGLIAFVVLGKNYNAPNQTSTVQQAPATSQEQSTQPQENTLNAGETREIMVSGTDFKFTPAEITAAPGEKVKITFTNNGQANHNLTVSGLNVGTETIESGQTASFDFTAPQSGTYEFTCTVPGHADLGMVGKLVVQ